MNNFHHPSELNPFRIYQQANKIAKRTSRAKNQDWYSGALEIPRQWHLWVDGGEVVSALFDSSANRWTEGPDISFLADDGNETEDTVAEGLAHQQGIDSEHREELNAALAEALRSRELGGKVKSLGVILHVADEFAILDPAREYSSNGDFEEVQQALQSNPTEVLGDSTADPLLYTWRILPCWGMKEGKSNVAVQLRRQRESFFSAIREYGEANNIAVVAAGVSAPLETLRLAPLYLEHESGRGDIIVMMYQSFSTLAVLDGEGELVQIRSLSHRAGMGYPAGLGDILLNTQTSNGLDNPVVSILPMNEGPAQDQLSKELTSFFVRKTPMDIGFNELDQIEAVQAIPGNRVEMLLGDGAGLDALLEYKPCTENNTFLGLAAGWASQDFYPVSSEEEETFPSWQELQLRKWFGVGKMVLLAAGIGLGVWGGGKVMRISSSEAWQAAKLDPQIARQGLLKLEGEDSVIAYWEGILKKRSPAWLVMQLPLDLFPENSGVVITGCRYSIEPLATPGRRNSNKAKKIGYARQWSIPGFSSNKGLNYLTKVGSNAFMRTQFETMAKKYGEEGYSMVPEGRTMNVTLQRKGGQYPSSGILAKKESEAYSTSFTLVITQNISAEDELALPITGKIKVAAKKAGGGKK